MSEPKTGFSGCPHCGRKLITDENKDGFKHVVGSSAVHMISCRCGIMTRLCKDVGELRTIWNSRWNKPWVEPTITVKHPPPRGAEPGTVAEDAF